MNLVMRKSNLYCAALKERHATQASIVNQNINTTSISGTGSVTNINWVNNVVHTTEAKVSEPIKEWQSFIHGPIGKGS